MVYPITQVHPETAQQHGIKDGDWIWIESSRGRIRQMARVFPGILPGVIMATANCFYPEEPGPLHGLTISSPNMLTSNEHFDPMYGSPDLTCLLCKIYKVEKKDMKDLPRGAYRLQGYEGDIGTVPFGQEGKTRRKR
jgi:anaerobic selenocysteine-containing dehydrogenase